MIFQNGHSYDLNDPDLQYFITKTQFDKLLNNWGPIYNFLNDIKYDLNYGDKKSIRYQFIKELYSRYQLQEPPQSSMENTQGSHLGSGLNDEAARSSAQSYTQQYIFLPSDPDELVDQLKLLYFEILVGNDSFLNNEQIIAITDKLLEYECITHSQHQNMQSNLITTCNV